MTDITLFFSYAQEDERMLTELKKHLQSLKRQGLLTGWYDHNIAAGLEWMQERANQLNAATLIALLISPDYLNSDYIYSSEMSKAMQRHEAGTARILPIFLRPTYWEGTPFAKLKSLPTDARPLTAWQDSDQAYLDVTTGISRVLKEIQAQSARSPEQLASPPPSSQPTPPQHLFTVPFLRDPFFTGREEILARLHTLLSADQPTALTQPPAISGLGGIGKTQTAIEYAHQHRTGYSHILWIRSETQQQIISDYLSLATTLNLPEKNAPDQTLIVNAVKRWLETTPNWLLIFDNADDLELAAQYFPDQSQAHSDSPGCILLTTRSQNPGGIAQKIDLKTLASEEGALLLLRRATLLGPKDPIEQASPKDLATARQITTELDGLPLALNQAGAYIEEKQCSLTNYLELYRTHRVELLRRRGKQANLFGHPDPVAATWQLSFQNIEAANPASAELLRLCAFLSPDSIPEEIFSEGAEDLGPILEPIATDPLALNDTISELLKYSLVRRDPTEQTLTIHRLVQTVLIDEMDEETKRLWAERCIKAVSSTLPSPKFEAWSEYEHLLPQAQACIALTGRWNFSFKEAALLLNQVGVYLENRHGQLRDVEALYRQAYEIYERELGEEHPSTLTTLHNLANLYRSRGEYEKARELYERVREVSEQVLGGEHPSTLITLNQLAVLYRAQGEYGKAQELYERVREAKERVLGGEHPSTLTTLNNLALLYQEQGEYGKAQELYARVREVSERVLGAEHPDTLMTLNNLAVLYWAQGEYGKAQELYERVREVRERVLGAEHPRTAATLYGLASIYEKQGRYGEAEKLYLQVLAIDEKVYGLYHREIVSDLRGLVELYREWGKDEQVGALLKRIADIEGLL